MNNFIESYTFLSMTLNERLKALRLNKDLGQAEVADIAGVSIPTVSEWETGRKNPGRKKLIILAEYYGVSLDYLIQGIEKKELSEEEYNLVNLYRNATDSIRNVVLTILNNTK